VELRDLPTRRLTLYELAKRGFPGDVSRLILLGIGTTESPRFAPYGLLLEYGHIRVGFDGGPGSEPSENSNAWLIANEQSVLNGELVRIAHETGMPEPGVAPYDHGPLKIVPMPIADHLHGYQIKIGHHHAAWAPECPGVPAWMEGLDVVFADGSRDWPTTQEIARSAKRLRVQRLVFVNLGAAALAALDSGDPPLYGEWGEEGRKYRL
jgi:hypothetical protein